VNFGTFEAPPRNVNIFDADTFRDSLFPAEWIKKMRLKRWQFYMVTHPEVTFGFIVIDLVVVSSSFFYVFDRVERKFFEHKRIKVDRNFGIADSLYSGRTYFRDIRYSVDIDNRLDDGRHDIKARIPGGRRPGIDADFTLLQSPEYVKPLVVSLPVGDNRGMYSHKVICPALGRFSFGKKTVELDPSRDTCVLDEHKAFYPHHTYWKWATFGIVGDDGKILGMNVTDNLIENQDRWNENAIWSGGEISLLGPVKFDFDIDDVTRPWKIRDGEGRLDLDFLPEGAKIDKTNALVVRMNYSQPYGTFSGKLVDAAGKTHEIDNAFGITEYHDAYY